MNIALLAMFLAFVGVNAHVATGRSHHSHHNEHSGHTNDADHTCPVCMDPLTPRTTLKPPCKHEICSSCYDGIFQHQENPSCPLCRASYTDIVPPEPPPTQNILRVPTIGHDDRIDWWIVIRAILDIILQILRL